MTTRSARWIFAALAGALLLAVLWLVDGRPAVEKLVLRCLSPLAVSWGVLTVAGLLLWREMPPRRRKLLLAGWVALTLTSNGTFAQALCWPLERNYIAIQPMEEDPFDAVVVLGGGLSQAVGGRVQLNQAGDRVILAARMYHAGKTRTILCTGTQIEAISRGGEDAASLTRRLLVELGVPNRDIQEVDGINTSDEMRHLASEKRDGERLGLITSAWHMDRALRLARSNGLDVEPLPVDFVTPLEPKRLPGPTQVLMSLVPSADALSMTNRALREYLARMVGR